MKRRVLGRKVVVTVLAALMVFSIGLVGGGVTALRTPVVKTLVFVT